MLRFILKLVICVLLALGAGALYLAARSGDLFYTVHEWVSPARFHQHDLLIESTATRHKIDPMLLKAVIWRESRFEAHKFGGAGERGLMQVGEQAAADWARENKIADFRPEELFDPKTNLEAGAWYLAKALEKWRAQIDPVPFALAEYNAGGSNARRWAGGDPSITIPPGRFTENIDYPTTRSYIESVMARRDFYKARGRM